MAYTLLNNLIGGNSSGLQYNLFDSHGSGGGETMKNGTPVWQIDGNYGLTSGVAEMLIQSQLGYIQLLPAIPAAWSEGSVEGLVARGNFEVSMEWSEQSLTEAVIVSNNGGECVIEYPTITKAVVLDENGKKVTVTKVNDSQISFQTDKGASYVITNIPEKPLGAQKFDQEILAENALANSQQWPAGYDDDGKAAWAFDNEEHWWHSRYQDWDQKASYEIGETYGDGKPTESNPIWIQTGFDAVFYIDHIDYTPRSNGAGIIKDYEVSVAVLEDPQQMPEEEDFTVVKKGTLSNSTSTQTIQLEEITAATHVRITVTSVNCTRDSHVNAKKIDIYGYSNDPDEEPKSQVLRIAGKDRNDTSLKVAEQLKKVYGITEFDAIIVATGKEYADALTGSYLAKVKKAPILLTNSKDDVNKAMLSYVFENASENAKIYILGKEKAVSAETESKFREHYANVIRLGGENRLETNIKILKEAGIDGQTELLIATSKSFADSLSAAATGKPILLVNSEKALNAEQKTILKQMQSAQIYILGGTSAVSAGMVKKIATVTGKDADEIEEKFRIAGENRFATSVMIAERFFTNAAKAVVACGSGDNFPDGLCGGALAAALDVPLLLTKEGSDAAADYANKEEIRSGYVLGGTGQLVSDEAAKEIFMTETILTEE